MHRPITRRAPRGAARSLLALAIALALAAAACGPATSPATSPTTAPTATPTGEPPASPTPSQATPVPASVFTEIRDQVVEIRGLEPRRDVEDRLLTKAEAADVLQAVFEDDNPPELVAATDRLLKGLGLVDPDEDVGELFLELIQSQVAGFYRRAEDRMYVISDAGFGGTEKVTYAHEYTHALQHQHWDPWGPIDGVRDQSDRVLAVSSLTEGDATVLMTRWALANLTQAEVVELLQAGLDPVSRAVLDRMPPILVQPLLFPYETGAAFVTSIQASGGWAAVDAAYDNPPQSTEQVIHPEKWQAGEAPIPVTIPTDLAVRMGDGWTVALEDTMGEFQLSLWLKADRTGRDVTGVAEEAAAGWGGDRIALLDGPDGAWAIPLLTEWDTPADADEFAQAATEACDVLDRHCSIVHAPGSTTVRVLIGSDTAAAVRLDSILGATGV